MWYEYLIGALAIVIVAMPIILHFVNKKKGKKSCGCDCGCCGGCDKCKKDNSNSGTKNN